MACKDKINDAKILAALKRKKAVQTNTEPITETILYSGDLSEITSQINQADIIMIHAEENGWNITFKINKIPPFSGAVL